MAETVRVEGLTGFRLALAGAGARLPGASRTADLAAAATAATEAKSRAEGLGGVAHHVAPSISAVGPAVTLGGAGYPMAMGANFGAVHNVERQTPRGPMIGWNQFPTPTRPDRIIYRTLRAEELKLLEGYLKMIDRLFHPAFPIR